MERFNWKKSHKYFYQIEGQIFWIQLKRVDFVICLRENVPLYVETVIFYKNSQWSFKLSVVSQQENVSTVSNRVNKIQSKVVACELLITKLDNICDD